jgi:hypothetical protein
MRVVIVKAWGIIRKIDLTSSIEYLLSLQSAKDFEIIEYKEVE